MKEYRCTVEKDFKVLSENSERLDHENIFSDEQMNIAKAFCDRVFEVGKKCSDQFVTVAKTIVQSSVALLNDGGDQAPCSFVVIGLGSVAKGEATPYSDLEYAFIVDHKHVYFEQLAIDTYFRIGNLGESPVKGFDTDEMTTDVYRPTSIDSFPVGYRIDGITTKAGNIPTGNGKQGGQSLTLTVEEFAKLYQISSASPFDDMAGDKSDMISSSVFIYSNDGDMSTLYEQFMTMLKDECAKAKASEDVNKKRFKSFARDIKSYTFIPEFVQFQPPDNLNVNVKIDIFRYSTLLANNLKVCLGLNSERSWDVYSYLHSQNIIADSAYLSLKIILALSIYTRTTTYLSHKSQKDTVSLADYSTNMVNMSHQLPGHLFMVFGIFLTPIKKSITSAFEEIDRICKSGILPLDNILIQLLSRLAIVHQNDKKCSLLKAELFYFIGDYLAAINQLDKTLETSVQSLTANDFMKILESISDEKKFAEKYVQLCCYILYLTDCYGTARSYFAFLIELIPENSLLLKLLSAHCMDETGDEKTAVYVVNQVRMSTGVS